MKKQLAAVMLSVCMMLMLLPTTAFAVENYDLYLYLGSEYVGTRITSENAEDVLGDGTVSYDPSTCTLTLNNARLAGIYTYGHESKVLTIEVIGECIIDSPRLNAINLYASTSAGPSYNQDSLVITGNGTLKINALTGSAVGISAFNDVTIKGTNVEINSANHAAIALQTQGDPDLDDIDLNIIDSTVTATTNASSTNAFWTQEGAIKIDNSIVTVKAEHSANPALWAATSIDITNKSNVTATGGSSNTFYSDGDININDSTVEVTDISEYAFPAVYAYGDITVENHSDLTAKSCGMRGIFTDGNMTINESTVTASGTTDEGMVVVGTLNVNNSKLTVSGSPDTICPAIVTERFNVTASDVTAYGGMQLWEFYSGSDDNISFCITPAAGKMAEFKVDGNNWDGSKAVHFREGTESPYDVAVNFSADEINWFGTYRYVHIGEHIHTGGTATCTGKAVCSDCGREYGDLDPDNHSFTNYVYNNDATCTENGTETAKCDRCDVTDTREKTGTALGHKAVKTEAKAATYTEDGNIEYWYCEACGKYFSDEALTQVISKEDTVIKAKGHGGTELKNESDSPETGDSGKTALWSYLTALILCGVFGLVFVQKKSKHTRSKE